MRCCIHEINYKGLGLGGYFFYHFVDLDLRVEIMFKKEGEDKKRGDIFWDKGNRHLCTMILEIRENFM